MIYLNYKKIKDQSIKYIEFLLNKENELKIIEAENSYTLPIKFDENISEIFESIKKIKLNKYEKVQFDLSKVTNFYDKDFLIIVFELIYMNYWQYYSKKTQNTYDIEITFINSEIDNYKNHIQDINEFIKVVYESKNLADLDSYDDGTPEGFVKAVEENLKEYKDSIKTNIYNLDEIEENNLNLISAIGKYSKNKPYLMELKYENSNDGFIALIGKGITFDSGGYALKSSDSMRTMRLDKCGGAVATSVIKYVAYKKLKINLVVFVPLCENSIGRNAILPSQVIKSYSGKTIQIDNPDAEGRLVLADSISFAQNKYKCKEVITIATLTGSITISLGKYMTGLFTNNYDLAKTFKINSDEVGDEVWILPIHRENIKQIKSAELADLTNSPIKSKHGSSAQAAAFLKEFILPKVDFLHLDIAGTAVIDNRSSGSMVKGIINYLSNK
ncbi:cytosol aminopeptidase [Spiroplasma litorale]|uniref:Probable cytosol aminopeptidase n=1 Tax=Spiroplasma litorale TaxID=216942 RepID=A0A0K1W1N3_9MOLU|nr:M17 family metallopeptidase [Spiroplasma litorale]AKX34230.1 cytosol aminopeptidase [Spiroplasma litorale]